MLTMTITDTEEMKCGLILQIWCKYEAVLVYFVWIVRCKSNACGKCELLHDILGLDLFFFDLFIFDDCLGEFRVALSAS